MALLADGVVLTSTTTGTGTLTLGAAYSPYLTPAQAGMTSGGTYSYSIVDLVGVNSEYGTGVWTTGGTNGTLTRASVLHSTNAGAAINCSGQQYVRITALAEDFGLNVSGTATANSAPSITKFNLGPNGATNPTLTVDGTAGSAATGVKVTAAAAASGVAVAVTSSGTNENLKIDAKGSGTVTIAGTSTGGVTVGSSSNSGPFVFSGADNASLDLFNGTTKGIRFGFTSASSYIEGVDYTGVGSYQPLIINASTLTLTPATTLSAALTYGGVTLSNSVTGTGSMVLATTPTITTPVINFGTGSDSAISANSTNTGHQNSFQVDNNGTVSNGATQAVVYAVLSAGANTYVQMGTTGGASPSASLSSGGGLTGGFTISAGAGTLSITAPALTGTPTAPTASGGTNTTQIATTAFVQSAVGGVGTGALTLISTLTASSSASLAWTSIGSYTAYLLIVRDILPATNNAQTLFQVGEGGGPTWKTSNYLSQAAEATYGSVIEGLTGSNSGMLLLYGMSNTGSNGNIGQYTIGNPTNSLYKWLSGTAGFYDNFTGATASMVVSGQYTGDTTAVTAFRVIMSSGNIASGTASLYGISS